MAPEKWSATVANQGAGGHHGAHDRRQETRRLGSRKARAAQARPAGKAQKSRRDRRPSRPRTDALRRLAVQRQGDGLLDVHVILSAAKDPMPLAGSDEVLRYA